MNARADWLIDVETLESRLGEPGLRILDLSKADTHRQYHVPGAVHLEYGRIVRSRKPVMGLLPEPDRLAALLGRLGIDPDTEVVAYDDEGGGKAGRLLWTLEVLGHRRRRLLEGGLHAWAREGHPGETGMAAAPEPGPPYPVQPDATPVADRRYILDHLGDPGTVLLDARSDDEYHGRRAFAARAGHIPGAVHFEWTTALDPDRNLRLRPEDWIRERLAALGVTPEREVIVYCQTHHRSSFSYVMLRALGFERVRGYPGSWSDWGNDPELPVES